MKQSNGNGWTRRHFLGLVAHAGGAAAVYETMTALGLINVPVAWAGPPQLPAGPRRDIIVLGSGVGGLTVSYLLSRAGHRVRILEAQDRAGGRSLTARRGTVVDEETENQGWTRQVCDFDDGLYVNLGPGRIPHHHRRVLHYCAELGVPLEVFVMENAASLFQTDRAFQGRPQVRRRIAHDTRGYLAELLSKAVNQSALDDALDVEDQERLLDLLRRFGALGTAGCDGPPCAPNEYCGSVRAGLREEPTVHSGLCAVGPSLELSELLRSEFWLNGFYNPFEYDWQATLFQPVGGMDQIVAGFLRALRRRVRVRYRAQVKAIAIRPRDVRVTYLDLRSGLEQQVVADACISNIPLPLLRGILDSGESNVSAEFRDAVASMDFNPGCKVGWQANRRFWELEDQIYGGMSFIDHPIIQMWYPSNDYSSQKGTLVGAYTFGEVARAMGEMSLPERLALTREGGEKLHPQIADPAVVPPELGISVAWQNVPWQRGAFPGWTDSEAHRQAYQRLLAPDQPDNPRLWVVGDQAGSLGAWQEGAMMSAEWVAQQVTGAIPLRAPEIFRAPESRYMVS